MVSNSVFPTSFGQHPIDKCRDDLVEFHHVRSSRDNDLAGAGRSHQSVPREKLEVGTYKHHVGSWNSISIKNTLHILLVSTCQSLEIEDKVDSLAGHPLSFLSPKIGARTLIFLDSSFCLLRPIIPLNLICRRSLMLGRHPSTSGSAQLLLTILML